ncbi:AMP-binding protein [Variovorax paradoxus]|uniref:AMP-binding protein n=1 Tax=Variovorax paradoxus TaxID=34073 RepID=UPI001ABC4089
MQHHRIRDAEDLARIEARPYASFMAHDHVYDALYEVATLHSTRIALSYLLDADPETPPRHWRYADLLADIRRAANLFASLVPGETPRVAMLLPAIPQAWLTLLGAETAGLVCPINYLLDAAHLAELVRASGANILVALGPHPELDIWARAATLADACPALRQVLAVGGAPGAIDFDAALSRMPPDAPLALPTRSADGLAALFHTGGTTGAPKLAQHTHRNQLHAAWSAAQLYAMREDDVILNGFPLFHVAGSFVYGLSALLSGARIVLPTLLGLRNTALTRRYWSVVREHDVSLLAAVPTVIATLLGLEAEPADRARVRALLTGGSPLPNELANAFEQKFGIPVRNILGMTECAGVVSIEPFLAPRVHGSCGIPLPFTEVKAVAHDGRDCAPGESGVLRLRGPNVGPGYTDAHRNAGTFEDGWLITGDIGHVDAQRRVFVTGRAKDLIIRSSHNIDPQVIEAALLQHPEVELAAAVGEPDEYAGELPVAYVSLRPGSRVDADALSAFANARIPERPAFPKRIEILAAIPLTAVGKVYKPRLRALACEHALTQRLRDAGLLDGVAVAVEDGARGLHARFRRRAAADAAPDAERLHALMRAFAIPYEIDDRAGGGA